MNLESSGGLADPEILKGGGSGDGSSTPEVQRQWGWGTEVPWGPWAEPPESGKSPPETKSF